jgi:[ribosomal protein S18]-alanine N-acetyltransferase
MLKDIVILPMTLSDMEDVLSIEKLSYSSPWPISQFEKELQNPISCKFTARLMQGGKELVAAYIIFWVVADEAHILNISTHPDFRKMGISKNLLIFALDHMEDRNVRGVFLEVRRSNIIAQKLYRGFGFKAIAVRKGYYGDNNEDAIVMALLLKTQTKKGNQAC